VGGARFLSGLIRRTDPRRLTVIGNTGDDEEFFGLHVAPDLDTVVYTLAGIAPRRRGWGLAGDGFTCLAALGGLGFPTWFRLGDRDLATHLARTAWLRAGWPLSRVTAALARVHRVRARVLPMTDDKVRTRFVTEHGTLSFQDYFVRERLSPRLSAIEIAGADSAVPSPEVTAALVTADVVVIGPSNPLISIGPILAVIKRGLHRERTVAVTPIVGGVALKGPTVEMMRALGHEPSPVEVARGYSSIAGTFVLDSRDAGAAAEIEALGYRVIVCDTVMAGGGESLAKAILAAL